MLHYINCLTQNTRCRLAAAGVFFAVAVLLPPLAASTPKFEDLPPQTLQQIQQRCLLGFDSPPPLESPKTPFSIHRHGEYQDITVPAEIMTWMSKQSWQQGYGLWLDSTAEHCNSPDKSYNTLLLHHYLIQTIKNLWPNVDTQLLGWNTFPYASDAFPPEIEHQFQPWPDDVIKNARIVSRLGMMTENERLSYWNTELEFAHWIECGSKDIGQSVNSLYGAMAFNGYGDIWEHNLSNTNQKLDSYLFWKMIGWIDKSWMKYRMKTSKKMHDPDFQADLLNQCITFNYWVEQSKIQPATVKPQTTQQLLFKAGKLNPSYKTKAARLLGEVVEIKEADNRRYYKLDLKLKGVEPVWVTSFSPEVKDQIKLGGRYVVIGEVNSTSSIDQGHKLSQLLNSKTLLISRSIQTPK